MQKFLTALLVTATLSVIESLSAPAVDAQTVMATAPDAALPATITLTCPPASTVFAPADAFLAGGAYGIDAGVQLPVMAVTDVAQLESVPVSTVAFVSSGLKQVTVVCPASGAARLFEIQMPADGRYRIDPTITIPAATAGDFAPQMNLFSEDSTATLMRLTPGITVMVAPTQVGTEVTGAAIGVQVTF